MPDPQNTTPEFPAPASIELEGAERKGPPEPPISRPGTVTSTGEAVSVPREPAPLPEEE